MRPATYYWESTLNPATGLKQVVRMRGPNPDDIVARTSNIRTVGTEVPSPEQIRQFRADLLAKLTTEKAWELHQTRDGTAPNTTQIATWRHELGLSQRGLAKRAGVSHGTVAMVESGTLKPKALLRKLGFALGKTEADW